MAVPGSISLIQLLPVPRVRTLWLRSPCSEDPGYAINGVARIGTDNYAELQLDVPHAPERRSNCR